MSFPHSFFFLFIFVLLLKYAYPTSQGHQHLRAIWGHSNAAIKVSVKVWLRQIIKSSNSTVWPITVCGSERVSCNFTCAALSGWNNYSVLRCVQRWGPLARTQKFQSQRNPVCSHGAAQHRGRGASGREIHVLHSFKPGLRRWHEKRLPQLYIFLKLIYNWSGAETRITSKAIKVCAGSISSHSISVKSPERPEPQLNYHWVTGHREEPVCAQPCSYLPPVLPQSRHVTTYNLTAADWPLSCMAQCYTVRVFACFDKTYPG